MSHKIFLSHNYNDKPLVEPIAIKLAEINGKDSIFYDSWSIKPGESIIDQMSKGLTAPDYVFFFVSENSLNSNMVKLEWQNALYAATKGKTKLIPVRVDGCAMPAILMQLLYIDMHTIGIEAAVSQIVNLVQGNSTFTPQHTGFSNLTCTIATSAKGALEITIKASHLLESNPNFAFAVINGKEDMSWWIKDAPGIVGGFYENMFPLNEGGMSNAIVMRPIFGLLKPHTPIIFTLTPKNGMRIILAGVLHDMGGNQWSPVPYNSEN